MRWSPIPPTNTNLVTEFLDKGQNVTFSSFPLVFLDWLVPYMIKPSSVTKRNIMDWIGKGLGIVYTPHQCRYSDRKSPYWDKRPKVP